MADADFSPAPRPAHRHPLARPGYGKRTAPEQAPRRRGDFAHLRPREASIAAFIDRLPEGAAMDAKTLAAQLPDYGQAACLTALRRLSEAGHLRRVTERIKGDGGSWHWVTRSHFSRTARDDAWWTAFLAGNVPAPRDRSRSQPEAKAPARSYAYDALASVGRTDPRMTLSAADCAALEELAAAWLARGADEAELVRTLTAGLPPEVHCAGALARRRLIDKMPPEPAPGPAETPLRMLECTICRAPGRPEALPGGICRDCRGEPPLHPLHGVAPDGVRARVAEVRAAVGARPYVTRGR
ncbi:hypothetical protein ACH427_11185 [Streptomyces sp. NPDC020379]|uniref:hypothetical protein n=1 Tax=Streptomyces sp. NPDC020379 TaxID=3365071 RepID=UPI00379BF82B